MESCQPSELPLNIEVKKSGSPVEDMIENETSTANSLLSIDKLHISNPSEELKPSKPSLQLDSAESNAPVEVPTVSSQVKCRYCDEPHTKELLAAHQENCEKRNILCEACGETVELDIFDFHLEICTHGMEANEMYPEDNNQYHFGMNLDNAHQGEQNQENWNEQENFEAPGEENEPLSDEEEEIDFDSLTYEQLMTLDNTIVKKGMSDKEMEAFPIDVFVKGYDEECACSVCISELESGEITRKLTCGHKFHKDCVDTWLNQNITCPVCKKYLR